MPKNFWNRIKFRLGWIETRRYIVFFPFVAIVSLGVVFLAAGLWDNPNISKSFIDRPTLTSTYGQTEFELPKYLENSNTQLVIVTCNVTCYDLAEGSPAFFEVTLEAPTSIYNYTAIYVEPHNTIEYKPDISEIIEFPTSSRIGLFFDRSKALTEIWKGDDVVEFKGDGPLKLTVAILKNPTDVLWNAVNWTEYKTTFFQDVTFNTINIKSGWELEQKNSEEMNLSLALIVAFFASVEISIALYDHSEDKEKKAEYDRERKARKQGELDYSELELDY